MNVILKYFTVYALSGFKFIFGPTLGLAYGFTVTETVLLTVLGMMTTVYLFTYLGDGLRKSMLRFLRKRRKRIFTKRNRRYVKVWQAYGVKGIALLTPLLLMPVGGALLVNLLGGNKKKIIKWMWISAIFWALLDTLLIYYAYDTLSTIPFVRRLIPR